MHADAADSRMSDLEAVMWTLDKDPVLSSTFGSLTIFDRAPDFDRLRRRTAYVVSEVPRLRQRVVPALGRLAPPEWRDDPDFDLGYHVRRLALPPDSAIEDLFTLAALLVQDPFDRTRPLWEFFVIEGLPDGRAAMLQKMHHTITDGEGGIRMSELLVDLTRDAEDPAPTPVEEPTPIDQHLVDAALGTLRHGLRRTAGVAQRSAIAAGDTLSHPTRLVSAGSEISALARSVSRQLLITDRAHSPLWRRRTLRRAFDTLEVPFDPAKRAAKELGGSLNDLFVAGATMAAGAYHRAFGSDVEELRVAMPISFRRDRSTTGNAFAPARVLLPVTERTPAEHFDEVRRLLTTAKQERAIGMLGAVAGLVNVLPTSVVTRFARQQVETIDFTASNVRAAPFDLYIAGALVEANYPLGPLTGTAWNLTMMSYRGKLDMGLHVDTGAVDDPALLRRELELAYEALITAGS